MLERFINWLESAFVTESVAEQWVAAPGECPHCELPVSKTVIEREGETEHVSWFCMYCGNSMKGSPERSVSGAWDRLRRQRKQLEEICENLDDSRL